MNKKQIELQVEHIFLDKLIRQVDRNKGYFETICEALEIDHSSSLSEILLAIGELKWISVEDSLPKKRPYMNYKRYLVTTGSDGFQADWMNDEFWYHCAEVGNPIKGVTHWKSLPKPPVGE